MVASQENKRSVDSSTSYEETAKESDIDVIEKSIGGIGRWQIIVFIALSLCKVSVAWHQLGIVFLAPPVNFTCVDGQSSKCSFNCTKYIYDRSTFTETIVTQWDLVCGATPLVDLAQAIAMLGIIIGNSVFGYLADRFGRRPVIISTLVMQIITSTLQPFVPWFSVFLVLRFLTATAVGGLMMTCFVMVMEVIGVKWRTTLGILFLIPYNLGHAVMPVLAYFLRDWRDFQLVVSLIPILLLLYYWLIPESPRWLLSKKEENKAIAVLTKIAKHNKLPTDFVENNVQSYLAKKDVTKKSISNVVDLIRTPIMRTYSICLSFNWFCAGLCFFGGFQYLGQLGGNIFINVALSAVVSIPGTLFTLYTVKAWGRKYSVISANALAAIALLFMTAVPPKLVWIKIALSLINIFAILITFSTVYIYSGELFPTSLRNVGVGTTATWSRFGAMVAPFIAGLSDDWLPPLIFGIFALIGALLCLKLPETLDCKLPETVEEAEGFATKGKFYK